MYSFANYFWGEKNNGFDVLYHNMKDGLISIRELEDFLRESSALEDNYTKTQTKLAKLVSNFGNRGSFAPFWQVMKTLAEKLSSVHQQLSMSWQELMKEVHKYNLEQQKRQREVKDQEASTLDAVQALQQTILSLHKAKESYHARCFECEKLKRENAAAKEVERAEAKLKKANDDYRSLIEKYGTVRVDFESSMTAACKRFQEVEEKHLTQLKEFVESYCRAWKNQYAVLGQVHEEFEASSNGLTVDKLIDTFIQSKTTGTEKPGPIEFVEADLSSLPSGSVVDMERRDTSVVERPRKEIADNVSQGSADAGPKPVAAAPGSDKAFPRGSHWILSIPKRRRNKKKKETQDNKKGEADSVKKNVTQVDDEGYTVRPENTTPQNNGDSFYSSSDSDSDPEDKSSKIKVEIKPITSPSDQTPNNVDDIRNLVKGLRLSPTANRKTPSSFSLKLSSSMSDCVSTSSSKPSEDLIGLDLFSPPTAVASPVNGSEQRVTTSESMPSMISASSLLLGSPEEMSSMFSNSKSRVQTPTGNSSPFLPGPVPLPRVSRSSHGNLPLIATARPAGRQTPDLFKTDRSGESSISSNSFASSASFGVSRGPSPLTIGMSDTIPLAVAFSETIHAYFKGGDQSRCRVKLTGDMVVSFPAGIIRVLVENHCPTTLRFAIKNISSLEQILVNKQLILEEAAQSTSDSKVYSFEMSALTDHLRRQMDQNRNAAYFNIDILKYQVKPRPGAESTPLRLTSYWKCEQLETDVAVDYSYNGSAMSAPLPLTNIVLMAPIDGQVKQLMQSSPAATWSPESKRITWKLGDISDMSENGSHGKVLAKFDLTSGPSSPSLTAAQFLCEGTTLSGIDFELAGPGYRLSLIKKRFFTGKYISEVESAFRGD